MTVFHVRQFVSVPYFIQLMVMTTTSTTLVQFLAASAWGGITPTQGWVRGGVVGMWTTTTCAAGIIGFERYKGTLVHLVMAPVGALRSLAAVVCAAASFGLVGCLALSLVIAALFVLTPNAIQYEGLLLVPVLVVSGIVFTSTTPPVWLAAVSRFLPLSVPFELLLGRATSEVALGAWLVCTTAWLGLAAFLGRRALRLATQAGTLEVV